jgi:retron-type reverse transcriptase
VDKIYKRKNLEFAWLRVKQNKGAGGIDGQSLEEFEATLDEQLERLHAELKSNAYQPLPVRQQLIPKAGQPGKFRPLGIPTIYDRVCQQAVLNRLEPIFEEGFDDASFGYRRGRSAKDALRHEFRGHTTKQAFAILFLGAMPVRRAEQAGHAHECVGHGACSVSKYLLGPRKSI